MDSKIFPYKLAFGGSSIGNNPMVDVIVRPVWEKQWIKSNGSMLYFIHPDIHFALNRKKRWI